MTIQDRRFNRNRGLEIIGYQIATIKAVGGRAVFHLRIPLDSCILMSRLIKSWLSLVLPDKGNVEHTNQNIAVMLFRIRAHVLMMLCDDPLYIVNTCDQQERYCA